MEVNEDGRLSEDLKTFKFEAFPGVCGAVRRLCVSSLPLTLPRAYTNICAYSSVFQWTFITHWRDPAQPIDPRAPLSRRICAGGVLCLSGTGLSGRSSPHPAIEHEREREHIGSNAMDVGLRVGIQMLDDISAGIS